MITYVARNLEPYRGFPTFMKASEILCRKRPHCKILIVGGDEVSYGGAPKDAKHWREKLLSECRIDPAQVHFLGRIPYAQYCKLLQISAVHVYLTYPFVLSWSMLEAMAMGCLVIGSATTPVEEVITDGVNGLLAGFFDAEEIATKIDYAFDHQHQMQPLRAKARETVVSQYSLADGLRGYLALINEGLGDGLRRPVLH